MLREYVDLLNGNYKRRSHRHAIVGVTLGVLAGSLLGILFAPKSGKELRQEIGWEIEKGAEQVKKVTMDVVDAAKEKFEDLRTKVQKEKMTAETIFEEEIV